MILEKTIELVKQIYRYHKIVAPKVTKVVIGLGYTGVEVAAYCYEPFLGVAKTLSRIIDNTNCSKIDFSGTLTERNITQLLGWSIEPPSLKKIIGIATLNAVSQHIFEIQNPYNEITEDLMSYLKINHSTRIMFIGFIEPMIKKASKITNSISIVDDNPFIRQLSNKFSIKKDIRDSRCFILYWFRTNQ